MDPQPTGRQVRRGKDSGSTVYADGLRMGCAKRTDSECPGSDRPGRGIVPSVRGVWGNGAALLLGRGRDSSFVAWGAVLFPHAGSGGY